MFQSILTRTVAFLSVFALVSLAAEVANAQSGSTGSVPGSFGGSVLQNSLPPQITGGSSSTQFSGGSSSTQFGGGSSSTQFSGGSSSTQFTGGSSSTQFGSAPVQSFGPTQGAPAQGCSSCGQQAQPAEPKFDCSQCGLPPVPQFNNGGFQYPQLRPTGLRGIMQNCPRNRPNCYRRF